ncbi:hypothetical protein L195_g002763 [Trifolium pratense]|uniref:Uncharacterized protein n=1 Tax=Trifolium pratense TaxID=57577 RepID=A0A2K3NTD5_TRIPR|nr:hypothetical protein L195_g002763 [Trifolium pratense]
MRREGRRRRNQRRLAGTEPHVITQGKWPANRIEDRLRESDRRTEHRIDFSPPSGKVVGVKVEPTAAVTWWRHDYIYCF